LVHAKTSKGRRRSLVVLTAMLALVGSLFVATPAYAWSGDHGYQSNSSRSYWGMDTGANCTNYVAFVLQTIHGQSSVEPSWMNGNGNAADWWRGATSSAGVSAGVRTSNLPAAGAIAWWPAGSAAYPSGHVAYVESAANGTFRISESGASIGFRVRDLTTATAGAKFIYFSGISLPFTVGQASISGTAVGHATLTARTGTWSPAPVFKYEWRRDGILVSVTNTYTLTAAAMGANVTLTVTGTRSGYVTASSTASVVPTRASLGGVTAYISGTSRVGYQLAASYYTGVVVSGSVVTYQWYINGVPKSGAVARTYVPTSADYGKRISVRVTITNPFYITGVDMSPQTSPVVR
jgi:hypothetical protein